MKNIAKQVTAVSGNASNLADLDRLFAQIKQEKGDWTSFFANAGGGSFARLGSITEEHYDQTFNTNVNGLLFTVQKALPPMDGGSIILNASIVPSRAWRRSAFIRRRRLPCVHVPEAGPTT